MYNENTGLQLSWLERTIHIRKVAGSSPARPTTNPNKQCPSGYFLFGFHSELTGREPEVRASKEPSENANLFAVF